MTDIRKRAHAKMLQEMNGEHSGAEDAIHNWLCEQEDERLLQGILEEGRTIKAASNGNNGNSQPINFNFRANRLRNAFSLTRTAATVNPSCFDTSAWQSCSKYLSFTTF